MNKTLQDARSFFKKTVQTDTGFTEGFEAKSPVQTPTIAIPITLGLTDQEKRDIQALVDEYQPEEIVSSRAAQHVEQLVEITKQIKSIAAQSVLLHGERIKQAQDLLANYRDGAFTKWLMSTYGNRQTPYSMLRYYEFYQSAPKEARLLIEAAPKKAVYLLASRSGDRDKKIELIQEHGTESQKDLLNLIQSSFPLAETDKRKPANTTAIEAMNKLCAKLESRSKQLSKEDRLGVEKIIHRLQKL
jgi:hypothetical protein